MKEAMLVKGWPRRLVSCCAARQCDSVASLDAHATEAPPNASRGHINANVSTSALVFNAAAPF
jgi:hypothetical protein